jgi:hypothetical protein
MKRIILPLLVPADVKVRIRHLKRQQLPDFLFDKTVVSHKIG